MNTSTPSEPQDPRELEPGGVYRRTVLRLGAAGGLGAALVAARGFGGPVLAQQGLLSPDGAFAASSTTLGDLLFYVEAFPTSPLILSPFSDPLPIPKALAPVPVSTFSRWAKPPGPGVGQQNSFGSERHQIWPSALGYPDFPNHLFLLGGLMLVISIVVLVLCQVAFSRLEGKFAERL